MANFNAKNVQKNTTFNMMNMEILGQTMEANPALANDFRKILVQSGIPIDKIIVGQSGGNAPVKTPQATPSGASPVTPAPSAPQQPEVDLEIDTKLQLLISSIPIANPGNIITSEYHNALRDAVRALASKLGLSVNPTAEFKILTFAPNFLPTITNVSAGVNLKWDVILNRATIPQIGTPDLNRPVSGGFVVQLPDSATIYQMIVRGTRPGTNTPSPKEFNVALKRIKFGKEQTQQTLITLDLKALKDGPFEEDESVKLSESEADADNQIIAGAKIADRKLINNDEWLYFVTADWVSGVENAAKFELNSIQILCTV